MAMHNNSILNKLSKIREKGIKESLSIIGYKLAKKLRRNPDFYTASQLRGFSNAKLSAIIRNDAHRIEKSYYNNIFKKNSAYYETKRDQIINCLNELNSRGDFSDEATLKWAKEIADKYDTLDHLFIDPNSSEAPEYTPESINGFLDFIKTRRSVRVWADEQPPISELREVAHRMIEAAGFAPSSGNRQGLRFSIIETEEQKQLLKGLKERHCYEAPITIFVGIEKDAYYDKDTALGKYIDSGLGIMCMLLVAHSAGLGTTVNHFAKDLINSWIVSRIKYKTMRLELNISDKIEPIALVNVGRPKFIPPPPTRYGLETQLISKN
jgi:nitroreductase